MVYFDHLQRLNTPSARLSEGNSSGRGSEDIPLPEGYAAVAIAVRDHNGFSYVYPAYVCPIRIAELVLELLAMGQPASD